MSSRISSLSQPVKRTSSGKDASNRTPTESQQGLSSSVDVQLHVADAELAQEGFRQPCPPCPYPSPKVWDALNVVVRYAMEHGSSHDNVATWYERAYKEALIYPHKRPSASEASIHSTISSTSAVSQNSIVSSATSYSNNTSPSAIRSVTSMALSYGEPCNFLPLSYSRPRAHSASSDFLPRAPIMASASTSPHIPADPRIPQEALDVSPFNNVFDWSISQQHDNNMTEVSQPPPKFFCTDPDCKINEEGFSTKDVWINHEKTIHETLEQYRCDQCDLVFRLVKRLRRHHKETHNCTGASPATAKNSGTNQKQIRCLHADNLRVKDLPQKGAWGCPYCAESLPKWEARINHIVKEHYMNHQVTKRDLSHTNVILGLLNQPYIFSSWSKMIKNRHWADIHWNNMPISKLKELKKELEYASRSKQDPDKLALDAFYWSSLCSQNHSTFTERADNHSSTGSQITAIFAPLRSLPDDMNDLADRHQRVDLLHSPAVPGATSPSSPTTGSLRKKKAHRDLNDDFSRPNSQEVDESTRQPFLDDSLDHLGWHTLTAAEQDSLLPQHESDGVGLDEILEMQRFMTP